MIELRASIGSEVVIAKISEDIVPRKGETIKFEGKNLLVIDVIYVVKSQGLPGNGYFSDVIIKAC